MDDIYLNTSNEPKFNTTTRTGTQSSAPDVSGTSLSRTTGSMSKGSAETTDSVNAKAVGGGSDGKSGGGTMGKVMPSPMPSYSGGGMVY